MTAEIAYHYLYGVFKVEFFPAYLYYAQRGSLRYELTTIQEICTPLLQGLDQDDSFLYVELISIITIYLQEISSL